MVVDVMLSPLSEMFSIVPVGANATLEQWYYSNTNQYSPNRQLSPLILMPTLKVFDQDTDEVYTPQRGDNVGWFLLNASTGKYDIEITTTDVTADYYKREDGALVVRKNVAYDASVSIRCSYDYLDPRDITIVHNIAATVTLSTNRDATVTMPTVAIKTEKRTSYNPFTDSTSRFTFTAEVTKDGADITSSSAIRWYASENGGAETLIDANASDGFKQFLCYVSGQGTPTLVVDAMYTENITIIARVMNTDASPNVLYPTKDYATLAWDELKMDIFPHSDGSGAVRSNTKGMTFDTIVNIRHMTLTDAQKQAHLFMNWKRRNAASSTVTDMGWGQTVYITGDTLRSASSQLVYTDVTMAGAYARVTDSGVTATDSGQIVVDRGL